MRTREKLDNSINKHIKNYSISDIEHRTGSSSIFNVCCIRNGRSYFVNFKQNLTVQSRILHNISDPQNAKSNGPASETDRQEFDLKKILSYEEIEGLNDGVSTYSLTHFYLFKHPQISA